MRILALALITSACTLGPDYHRPCVDIPCSYSFEDETATGSLNIAWWEQFQDSVLVSLIEEALENNKDIQIAASNILQAEGFLIQTRSQLFPQIGYDGFALRQRLSETTANPLSKAIPNPQNLFQLVGNVNWEIDLWGRVRRLTESARAQVFASIELRRAVILSLVGSVANGYLQLRGLDAQLVIAKRTQKSYLEALNYFKLQYQYGQISQLLVAQAKTQYEIASSKIPDLELQITLLENALSVLLGRNPNSINRGKSIFDLILPEIPEGIPASIITQRPDIQEAENKIIAANAQIGASIALYFPSFSLTGAYGGASKDLSKLFNKPSTIWSFMESVSGPIFTWGAIQGQIIQARAETLSAVQAYELAILKALADVENALASRLLLTKELESLARLVEAAKEYVRLSKLQYDGGYSPYFVVIQAQQQLFPAELTWVQTRVLLLSAYTNIYLSMGGGWVHLADELTCSGI